MNAIKFTNYLEELFPDSKCELNYKKDYELLIATVLSAQSTDKRVNIITKELFDKYKSIKELNDAKIEDLERIIKPCGQFRKKSIYIKNIAKVIHEEHKDIMPKSRELLEKLKGVGRKTTNVVLNELYNEPLIGVDTHVIRITKRLGIAKEKDTALIIEKKLMKLIPLETVSFISPKLVLFGRYHCTARNPKCNICKLQTDCKYYKNKK